MPVKWPHHQVIELPRGLSVPTGKSVGVGCDLNSTMHRSQKNEDSVVELEELLASDGSRFRVTNISEVGGEFGFIFIYFLNLSPTAEVFFWL